MYTRKCFKSLLGPICVVQSSLSQRIVKLCDGSDMLALLFQHINANAHQKDSKEYHLCTFQLLMYRIWQWCQASAVLHHKSGISNDLCWMQEVIGKGSYGVVCSAVDSKTGEKVAIKKINNVFDHVSDATRILREIKLLRLLRHPGKNSRHWITCYHSAVRIHTAQTSCTTFSRVSMMQ